MEGALRLGTGCGSLGPRPAAPLPALSRPAVPRARGSGNLLACLRPYQVPDGAARPTRRPVAAFIGPIKVSAPDIHGQLSRHGPPALPRP